MTKFTLDDSKCGIFRISDQRRASLERHLYKRYPDREWGTFFRFGFRRTKWGIAVSFIDGLWPQPGELRRDSPIVTINSDYSLRAIDAVSGSPFGVGMIHSHPQGCSPLPSALDDDMDGYYSKLFQEYAHGRPFCSLIFSRSADESFRFTGRVHIDGRWFPINEMITIGDVLGRETPQNQSVAEEQATPVLRSGESVTGRLEMLLGNESVRRLRGATVAIIGCSGTGSPAIEVLARAGVGQFVLVDPQRFSASNLERLHGSTRDDVGTQETPYKIAIMARMIREINPRTKVTTIVGNLLDELVLDELLRADLILGCTDTQHSRAALGDFAAHYLVPSIDVGVVFEGANGNVHAQVSQFTQFRPDQPCAFCDGMIDSDALAVELMTGEEKEFRLQSARKAIATGVDGLQYWRGDTPQLITVGYLTSSAGSMAAGYAIGWLTGKFSMPHSRFQFDISKPEFGFVGVERKRVPSCSCGLTQGFADQARPDRSVSMPAHWPAAFMLSDSSSRACSEIRPPA